MNTGRSFTEQAKLVLQAAEHLGIAIPPSSRLRRMHDIFSDSLQSPIPPEHPEFEVALEATRDLTQLAFIFEQLSEMEMSSEFRERLKKVVKDSVLPQENLTDSHGRNAQCELYVAAICMKAKLNPTFAEPDLRIMMAGKPWSVAIKRIKSYSNFKDRIKGAIEQVNRQQFPGVVIADISVMLNRTNERIIKEISNASYQAIALRAIHKFIGDHENELFDWSKGSSVRGIVFLDHHVRQHPESGWGLDSMSTGTHLCPFNQRRRTEFNDFMARYRDGLASPAIDLGDPDTC